MIYAVIAGYYNFCDLLARRLLYGETSKRKNGSQAMQRYKPKRRKEIIMKSHRIQRTILVVTVVALTGIAGVAFANPYLAGRNLGYGGNPDCPRFQNGGGKAANLSDEQIAQIEKLRSEFNAATADLRQNLRQKELSLQAELAKKSPDAAAAAGLQKEISALSADLDAKRLAHRLEVHKIAPQAGLGYGPGPHHGRGGQGSRRS